jgi:hypothetical protein
VQAFRAAADPQLHTAAGPPHAAERLYFTAFTPGLLKWLVQIMPLLGRNPRRFGRNADIDLVAMLKWKPPYTSGWTCAPTWTRNRGLKRATAARWVPRKAFGECPVSSCAGCSGTRPSSRVTRHRAPESARISSPPGSQAAPVTPG